MNAAKIRLSAKEMELVTNADWILTKNEILQKANQLLGVLLDEQKKIAETYKTSLPVEVFQTPPKISKGENYKGLPYLVLDHPRYFDKENSCAIRTMFWWGNFFSITLHLSGKFKDQFEQKLMTSLAALKEAGFFLCVNDEEWEHHFEEDNYLSLEEMNNDSFQLHIRQKKFLKLAHKIPIQNWDDAVELLACNFNRLLKLLAS
jgi:hypothetical protein